jgi:hypothetical protein
LANASRIASADAAATSLSLCRAFACAIVSPAVREPRVLDFDPAIPGESLEAFWEKAEKTEDRKAKGWVGKLEGGGEGILRNN